MAYRAALLNFSKGEISPELEARFDLSAYQVGLRKALNVKIRKTGGVSKRMGMRFVVEALSTTARLFPFQFSDEQGYALENGQAYMRPLALGGAVLEEGLKVISIVKGATTLLEVNHHDYSIGDQVYVTSDDPATFGMSEIISRWLTVLTVPDGNHITVDYDSTAATDFGTDTGTNRTVTPPPPPPPPPVPTPLPDPVPPDLGSSSGGGYVSDPGGGGGGGSGIIWSPRGGTTAPF
jgi:hypothetical protein